MEPVQTLCSQLGLSHQQLSRLIDCDRSVLSRSLKATRTINTQSTLRLLQLLQYCQQIQIQAEACTSMQEKEKLRWKQLIAEQEYQLVALQRRLALRRQKMENALRLLQLLPLLAAQPLSPRQQRYLPLLQEEAENRLRRNTPASVLRMEIRLQLINSEIALMKQVLEEQTGTA